MGDFVISDEWMTVADAWSVLQSGENISLSNDSRDQVAKCRVYINESINKSGRSVYGINTGFGALHNTSIPEDSLETLQYNLVRSHASGIGDEVPEEIVRIMLFLKIKGLSYGKSGASVETIERLIHFYNDGVTPQVFTQGSLGASGDLAPLAHLALPLIGEGRIRKNGELLSTADYYKEMNLEPVRLQSKEGLALLNGTQFMSAYSLWCVMHGRRLMEWADFIGAMSLDGYDGRQEPFTPQVHDVRAHAGQVETAARYRKLLKGSELITREKSHVQDPYSFRCIPQVHGASKDTLGHVSSVLEREINSVTDNPTVFPDEELVVSAGNFHGQPLALTMDFLAIAMAEIASISERRTYKLISGKRDLPAFLVADPGLNSGLMIPQYTAASIVSQNKQLCTPASVDTIDSSNGQEDHVSMGANAATKARQVVLNTERVLAIELLNASQALDFRKPVKSSEVIEGVLADFRQDVTFVETDRWLHEDIQKSLNFIRRYDLSGKL